MKKEFRMIGIVTLAALVMLIVSACDLGLGGGSLDAPSGVTATKLSSGGIHITWNKVSGAEGYIIDYRRDLDSADTRMEAGTSSQTTFTHSYYSYYSTDVTTLYYYVKAYKDKKTDSGTTKVYSSYSSPASVDIK
ncbi:MAG: fibronectin type III domain-containing protein [Treponema sp.]|nr:fibronectin type III domain-containing protein [Treponema sp.]